MDWSAYKCQVEGSREVIVFPYFEQNLSALGGVAVDLGCGDGDLTNHIADVTGAYAVGIDADPKKIEQARSRYAGPHFLHGRIDKNSLSSAGLVFDFAFSNCCFCHLSDEAVHETLFDLYSVMKEGGNFVLLVPSLEWAKEMYSDVAYETSGISAVPRQGGRQFFRPKEWYAAALSRCGFQVTVSEDLRIPDDERLEDRYRQKVGVSLFSALSATRVGQLPDSEAMGKAFEIAHDNRKLEIQLFWQRSLFFWGFVAAALVAYGAAYNATSSLQIVFALFGLVCSVVWSAGNRGSKYWQEYWEGKVNLFQHYVTGNIFYDRSPQSPRLFDVFAARRTSVSKLTMALSDYAVFLWLMLCVVSTYKTANLPRLIWFGLVIVELSTLVYCLWMVRRSKSED